ncbi:magnesium transporter CorA family protein [Pediococcus siamensis]|uniref:magnesium transporter CorA family protein n=1 Tax=Pediococcus siamensis TaxID=381829 RepID=UPI00399FA517
MILQFNISNQGVVKTTNPRHANWLVLKDASSKEIQTVIDQFQLPNDIFIGSTRAEEVTRFEKLSGTSLNTCYSLVLMDLTADTQASIETRLEPISFVISDSLVITHMNADSVFIEHLLEKKRFEITSKQLLMAFSILTIYTHYIKELTTLKQTIDELDQAARKTTENKELFRLADTERRVVYLDHTLQDQAETLDVLWTEKSFVAKLDNEALLYDIKLRQRHAGKMIRIYRDLLETIGGLFTDMMDNNLNHLMKYLDSAGLIISVPALIAGIWGMNTGGMPAEGSSLGFLIVTGLALGLGIVTAIHLKRKDYSK